MSRNILIINGHPDAREPHFGHALADAYAAAAEKAGHQVERIDVAALEFPWLHSQREWREGETPEAIKDSQRQFTAADHLVIVYPLWLGTMPAVLKAYFEQLLRPGFAFSQEKAGTIGRKLLARKSARIIVTMGMPGFFYRWFYRAHSLKSLERNILSFVGIKPVRHSVIGLVEGSGARRLKWLDRVRSLGARAA